MSVAAEHLRRQVGRIGMGLVLVCAPIWLAAQPANTASAPAGLDILQWVARIRDAAANRSYQGTMLISAGGVVSTSRMAHFCDGKQRYERVELLDGRARLRYRHNEQLVTVWPGDKLAVLEVHDGVAEFPALPDANSATSAKLSDLYEIRRAGSDRIAGHEAEVLILKPRDGHRFAQRLWAERDTGLLLRNDVMGSHGEVLESTAFTDLRIGGKAQPEAVTVPMKRLEGLRVVRPQVTRTQLEAEGWQVARQVPGFQLISCSKRPLDVSGDSPPVQVLQSVFSDGLANVSVFVEPYDAQRHKQAMRTTLGATHTVMGRRGDWWVTVVGEVPMTTVMQFESMLERRR